MNCNIPDVSDIFELDLLPREHYHLLRNKIYSLNQLCAMSPEEILQLQGIGAATLKHIQSSLLTKGMSLSCGSDKEKRHDS